MALDQPEARHREADRQQDKGVAVVTAADRFLATLPAEMLIRLVELVDQRTDRVRFRFERAADRAVQHPSVEQPREQKKADDEQRDHRDLFEQAEKAVADRDQFGRRRRRRDIGCDFARADIGRDIFGADRFRDRNRYGRGDGRRRRGGGHGGGSGRSGNQKIHRHISPSYRTGMVKPQATASRKAGMNCTGEHISTAARSRRPDRRKGRSSARRHGGGQWMHGEEKVVAGCQKTRLSTPLPRPIIPAMEGLDAPRGQKFWSDAVLYGVNPIEI